MAAGFKYVKRKVHTVVSGEAVRFEGLGDGQVVRTVRLEDDTVILVTDEGQVSLNRMADIHVQMFSLGF